MNIEVRALTVDDVFTVVGMLKKGMQAEIASAVKGKGEADPTELGVGTFLNLFVEAKEDLKAWLADLIGKTKEEFQTMPPSALMSVIRTLFKQEDFKDFLAQVKELWGEMVE